MKALWRTSAACFALCLLLSPLHAATQQECLSLWKTVDTDANGALEKSEDTNGYIAAARKSGLQLQQGDVLSRDGFLQLCADDAFAAGGASTPSPAAQRDLGKGDLTPAKNPLNESDARSKLEASGFREIQDLKLGTDAIWRGTAVAQGERQSVAIDAQGDIVAKSADNPAPAGKMEKREATTPPATAQSAELVPRGTAGPGGLILWTFLLIGNAIALGLLSWMTSAGTSAMSSRTDASDFA